MEKKKSGIELYSGLKSCQKTKKRIYYKKFHSFPKTGKLRQNILFKIWYDVLCQKRKEKGYGKKNRRNGRQRRSR
jgi:hypothetical protein